MTNKRIELIQKMLQENPNDCFLNYASALEYAKEGNSKLAIEIMEKLVKQDQNYLATYYQLGKLYEQEDQVEKALVVFKKGIIIAKQQENIKAIGELEEALMILDDI